MEGIDEREESHESGSFHEADVDPYEIRAIEEVDEEQCATPDDASPHEAVVHAQDANMRPLLSPTGEMSDWMECANADGDKYYCNLVTNETSWDPPFDLLFPVTSVPRVDSHTGTFPTSPVNNPPSTGDERTTRQMIKRVLDGSLRRLDPHTQMQLEEARRRHKELEELRDEEVLMGGEHWVEMYDPTHGGFYYYGIHSGEMRWDKPDSYVMNVAHDDVLRMVVRMQCAFRIKLARRKVFMMKLQRGLIEIDRTGSVTNPWVEVYDPFHKVLYYYSSATGETRWDPPEHFISASEDREMAAAIAIQSMSRSHLARREVKKRKATIRKKQHDHALEESKKLRELRRKEYAAKTDDERESICRREMLEEEMEQIREGDLYWGVDKHDQEVVRQRVEERLLADAESFWHRVNMTLRMRNEMEKQRSHEDEARRREQGLISEAKEGDGMQLAEAEQCALGDCFWGIQAEEQQEAQSRQDMDTEDSLSRVYGDRVFVNHQHLVWAQERDDQRRENEANAIKNEERHQRAYFKWFYRDCQTADDVLEYRWPSHTKYEPMVADEQTENQPPKQQVGSPIRSSSVKPGQAYVLDDIVLRQRLETDFRYGGRSVFTVHDPASARTSGRRGQYVVTRVDTEPVFTTAAKQADRAHRPTSPTRPMPQSSKMIIDGTDEDEEMRIKYGMFPALHRRGVAPDPNVPARYNGIPYLSRDMTATEEILLRGTHTKLTKLPALPGHQQHPKKSPTAGKSKPTEPKKKKPSLFSLALQENNNAIDAVDGFASPFFQDPLAAKRRANQKRHETENERAAREQRAMRRQLEERFMLEELAAVRDVFEFMDCDGSGTINKKEMVWALQRDSEVHHLANQSALLRLLLKQPAHLEELFNHLRRSEAEREEITWDMFRVFCEEMYISLTQQGILLSIRQRHDPSPSSVPPPPEAETKKPKAGAPRTKKGSVFVEANEERLIRRVFRLCDHDGNGKLEVDELRAALSTASTAELETLVHKSKALQPLLQQETFIQAFTKFEPMDPRGISEEEFVVLCLEIADIALLNGML